LAYSGGGCGVVYGQGALSVVETGVGGSGREGSVEVTSMRNLKKKKVKDKGNLKTYVWVI